MEFKMKYWKFSAAFVFSFFLLPAVTQAQHYKQTNLVSNIAGMAPTPVVGRQQQLGYFHSL